jgi:hypothetical protein
MEVSSETYLMPLMESNVVSQGLWFILFGSDCFWLGQIIINWLLTIGISDLAKYLINVQRK